MIMLKRALQLLKRNPVIILIYAGYMLLSLLLMLLLYPKNIQQFMFDTQGMFSMSAYLSGLGKLFLAVILIFLSGLFFLSGFGNMLREAVFSGRTSGAAFLAGIRLYFVRILLMMLLMTGFAFGASLLIGIITVPITVMTIMSGTSSVYFTTMIIMGITLLLLLIPLPFLILWIPAIFLEDTGVIQGLKAGARAGSKNYWRLALSVLLLYLPMVIYTGFNYDAMSGGRLLTVGYIVLLFVSSVMSLIFTSYIFMVYHYYKINIITAEASPKVNND